MDRRLLRQLAFAVACVAVPVIALLTTTWYLFDRSPVPRSKLSQVMPGMPQSQVRSLLGTPAGVWPDGTWIYAKKSSWPVVRVKFDGAGNVVSCVFDN
jgi:hypothetical protein